MRTNLAVLVDRSGSMGARADEASSAINAFIADQQALEGKCWFTMVEFDNASTDVLYDGVKLRDVTTDYQLVPRGLTPLLDALGSTIQRVDKQSVERGVNGKPPFDKTIFVIITDGLENDSTEFNLQQIQAMIAARTEAGWDFVYIGAAVDKFGRQQQYAQAQSFGTRAGSTVSNDASNYAGAMVATASAVTRSRLTGDAVEYTDEERAQAEATPDATPDAQS